MKYCPGDANDAVATKTPNCPVQAFVSVLTPDGRGAIAVVRVWGPDAIDVANSVFRPYGKLRLAQTASGRLRLGRIGDALGDEVVAVVLEAAVPTVEVQCHGGTAAVELVVSAFEKAGTGAAIVGK